MSATISRNRKKKISNTWLLEYSAKVEAYAFWQDKLEASDDITPRIGNLFEVSQIVIQVNATKQDGILLVILYYLLLNQKTVINVHCQSVSFIVPPFISSLRYSIKSYFRKHL